MKKTLFFFAFLFFTLSINAQYSFYVLFHRPATWGTVTPKIHIFGTPYISDTNWPGISMEKTCSDGWFVYKVPSPASFVNFVINNGNSGSGNQTQDLSASATVFYEYDTAASSNPAYQPLYNPSISNTCVKINPPSGTWDPGTNVTVTLEAILTQGNTIPTIYYTQDGSQPTTSSPSFSGTGTLTYNSGANTLKAFAYTSTSVYSNTVERQYNFTNNGIKVHLIIDDSSLTSWLSNPMVHYWSVQTTNGNISDSNWPGVSMYSEGTNQFYYFFADATSVNLVFNNGNSGTGNQTSDITNITSEIWYHYPSGMLSTKNFALNKNLKIYPNPAEDFVKISSDKKVKNILFTDAKGSFVKSEIPLLNSVNISKLKKGFYLMKITFEDGTSIVEKLIKE